MDRLKPDNRRRKTQELLRTAPRFDFATVRLSEVPLHEEPSASGDHMFREVGDVNCEAEGAFVHLHVERSRRKSQGQAIEGEDGYTFRLSTAENTGGVEASCYFSDWFKGQLLAKTGIQRTNGDRLPKGLGLLMYQKVLVLIQERANAENKTILHDIERDLTVSQTPLTEDRWNELFVPILLEHGYTKLSEDRWEKRYQPTPTQSA